MGILLFIGTLAYFAALFFVIYHALKAPIIHDETHDTDSSIDS